MKDDGEARERRGDRTRAALVKIALELFGRQGIERTSIDEITQAANVAKGTFYVHFRRKQDVLIEALARIFDALDPSSLPANAADALHGLGEQLVEAVAEVPRSVVGRMVREIIGNQEDWVRILGERRRGLTSLIQPIVAQGQATGDLRDDQAAARLAQSLAVLWFSNIILWAERPDERPLITDLDKAISLFLDGARR